MPYDPFAPLRFYPYTLPIKMFEHYSIHTQERFGQGYR